MSLRRPFDRAIVSLQTAAQYLNESSAPLHTYGADEGPSLLNQSLTDIKNAVDSGPPFSLSDLPAYLNAVTNLGGTIDDRKFLLEKLMTLMSRLGADSSEFGLKLQQCVIGILYKDLPHPPSGYLALPAPNQRHQQAPIDGSQFVSVNTPRDPADAYRTKSVNYAYRSADGSDYNPLIPSMGKAGSPYARSVPSLRCLSPAALPDPELVFDKLLKRDEFKEHPGGISSLFFAFAEVIIHNIFNTDLRSEGWTRNKASSYLDLSPLYGSSQEEVKKIRRGDGTGRILDDVFSDSRLLYMPPAVGALLVLFNRNHNYIAEKIFSINEGGTFKDPGLCDPTARVDQDEEIFQRARLVNTAYFMQIILRDYVGSILALTRYGSSWRLDPLMNTREIDHEVSPRGEGNVVSVEFNLLYRWHSAVSQPDVEWTENLFAESMKGVDMKTVSVADFAAKVHRAMKPDPDIEKWTFGGLKRTNGRFADSDLARILQNATAAPAGAFGARATPEVLRVVELLSIEQGRKWGVCTLNEFRAFMGLNPYKSFLAWNPDKNIADAAEALYHHIDNLELYVGMQAEETKEPMPGAGLCPGYTMSRAILADAVALTRGDRFMTIDFTPFNLTTWGYNDCQADTADGSFGGMMTKLLFRHLPDYYPAGSAYAHFPMMVPEKMVDFAKGYPDDVWRKYNWDRPSVPAGPPVVVNSYSGVQTLFSQPTIYTPCSQQRLEILTGGVQLDFTFSVERVLTNDQGLDNAAQTLSNLMDVLIKTKQLKGVGAHTNYIDIVRDVINLVPVYWLSNDIIGLPLKVEGNPRGTYREQDLYSWFANIANYVYCNTDPSNDWALREQSQVATGNMIKYLKGHLEKLTRGLANVEGITGSVRHWISGKNDRSERFLNVLVKATGSQSSNSALDGLSNSLFASVVPTAALFSQIIAHVVNFYLGTDDADKVAQREKIVGLVKEGANAEVMPYVFEALRLDPPLSSVLLTARSATSVAGTEVAEGQHVLAGVIGATHDPLTFPSPEVPNYGQQPGTVADVLGLDPRGLLSPDLFDRVVPCILGKIFELKNLRRQPSQSGKLTSFTEEIHSVPEQSYRDMNGRLTPFPVSLIVQFDD
jgi:hypothetical protein